MTIFPPYISRELWNQLPDQQKLDRLYEYVGALKKSTDALSATVQTLQERLNKLDRQR